MTALPTVFGDGVIDVHVASGVARITLGAQTGASAAAGGEPKPVPSALLVVPVLQLPNLARVLVEVTKQIEARAKEAMAAQQKPAEQPQAGGDQVAGAFRFNG
ncbi:hypothetical protein G3576_10640 [Roseomonas stagni]|uniref:Uncharacterized protein n=1 Tax=Falsiroseomonas algicola TaxID=2716930 RepID=A0A6M1LJZ0_9PROT|nr:hypothetical protein [Falsiroseomonas algicola]NGM20472.1 hypothetical protein [Falsiroseomonas algicola]